MSAFIDFNPFFKVIPPKQEVAWWIIAVAALAGVLLLVLIVLVFWRVCSVTCMQTPRSCLNPAVMSVIGVERDALSKFAQFKMFSLFKVDLVSINKTSI